MDSLPMIGVTLLTDFLKYPPPYFQKHLIPGSGMLIKPTVKESLTICTQGSAMFPDSLGKVIKVSTEVEFDELTQRLLTRPLILDAELKRTHKNSSERIRYITNCHLIVTVNPIHPTIKTQLVKAVTEISEHVVARRRFALEISLSHILEAWYSTTFKSRGSPFNTSYRTKYARIVITNCSDFSECFEMGPYTAITAILCPPYGLLLCPAYRIGRCISTTDRTCQLQGEVALLSFEPAPREFSRQNIVAAIMTYLQRQAVQGPQQDAANAMKPPQAAGGMPPLQAPSTTGPWHTPPAGYSSGPTTTQPSRSVQPISNEFTMEQDRDQLIT